jgi:hypothetical protein
VKVYFSQQGSSCSGIPPQGTDSIGQPVKLRRQLGGRDSPVVKNLLYHLGASSSGITPRGASGCSKPVDWEPEVLAFHHGELRVPANPWTRVTYNMMPSK